MKTRIWISAASAAAVMTLAGCAAGPNQQLGAGGGAIGGALIGNAIGGNTAATVGGAAIGGLIGNEVGKNADQRNYERQQQQYYNSNRYYPNNGPRY
ncbi:MAG: hypothetical protein KKC79_00335 [Gammaproteobacteria bacterium]|nr:hypothetical protein [Gammaproteobacteria bacterium]MBU1441297.1 hypothetical protein [Gammaproteobacteria bacterium]MBU2286170.1 hypothetical protein [Gammaproteobacteria bacterium]MBU2407076.1 hypothetical protein [Gammaproteobacteria bacterium]